MLLLLMSAARFFDPTRFSLIGANHREM